MAEIDRNKIRNFKDLLIWQKGMEIVKEVYRLTQKFPKEELYGLTSQMKRSSVSIPSNIAEGFMRFHKKEKIQFLSIVLGSGAELETQSIIAEDQKFITMCEKENLVNKIYELDKMTMNSIKKI